MSHLLGVSDIELDPGAHICGLYPNLADRDDILNLYLREGLNSGDKCLCVVDSTDPDSVLAGLGADIDLEPFLARHQLDVRGSPDTTLRGGKFSGDAAIEFWDREVGEALAGEFSFVRLVGEMTWAKRSVPGVEEFMAYESRLNRYLPRHPQMMLCLYEIDRFGGEALVDVLKVHPKVLLGGMAIDNPYYIEPEEFLATRDEDHA